MHETVTHLMNLVQNEEELFNPITSSSVSTFCEYKKGKYKK